MPVVLKRFIKGSDCEPDIIFVSHGTHGLHGFLFFSIFIKILLTLGIAQINLGSTLTYNKIRYF